MSENRSFFPTVTAELMKKMVDENIVWEQSEHRRNTLQNMSINNL